MDHLLCLGVGREGTRYPEPMSGAGWGARRATPDRTGVAPGRARRDCAGSPLTPMPKRTATIQLGFLHGLVLGAAGCSPSTPAPDPCEPELYQQEQCEQAVGTSGYHYRGVWIPRVYPHPSLYYAGEHDRYVARGGVTTRVPTQAYRADYLPPEARAASVAERATPNGTRLSPSRMTALATRAPSLAGARRGATVSRGGFGAIGSGRAFRGG